MAKDKERRKRTAADMFPEAFRVRDNILLLCRMYGVSDAELAEALGTSRETLRRRKMQPWKYTEYEKKVIAGCLHVSVGALYTDLQLQFAEVMDGERKGV